MVSVKHGELYVCWHIFGGGEELREPLNIPEQSGAGMRKKFGRGTIQWIIMDGICKQPAVRQGSLSLSLDPDLPFIVGAKSQVAFFFS